MTSPRTRLGDPNDPRIEAQQAGTGTREYSAIPEPTSENTEAVLKALKESVEGMLGSRGSLQSNGVLVEDLESLGLIRVEDNGFVRNTIADTLPASLSMEEVHPVGTLFIAVVATNPSVLLGIGTWARIGAGTLLMDGGGGFVEGTAYGQATSNPHGHGSGTLANGASTANKSVNNGTGLASALALSSHGHSISGSVANNTPTTNDNYPPTLAVYMWKRTA